MPFKSQAQRRYMYARHPELAKEFEDATPKGKSLPDHVTSKKQHKKLKEAFYAGITDSLADFNFVKTSGKEIRLKLNNPKSGKFHGYEETVKKLKERNKSGADQAQTPPDNPLIQSLVTELQNMDVDIQTPSVDGTHDKLERPVAWGAANNLAGGDTGSRISSMGQMNNAGPIF